MSVRKNSIALKAQRVTVQADIASTTIGMTITVHDPSERDLLRLVAEASALLQWRQKRKETA